MGSSRRRQRQRAASAWPPPNSGDGLGPTPAVRARAPALHRAELYGQSIDEVVASSAASSGTATGSPHGTAGHEAVDPSAASLNPAVTRSLTCPAGRVLWADLTVNDEDGEDSAVACSSHAFPPTSTVLGPCEGWGGCAGEEAGSSCPRVTALPLSPMTHGLGLVLRYLTLSRSIHAWGM